MRNTVNASPERYPLGSSALTYVSGREGELGEVKHCVASDSTSTFIEVTGEH